MPTATESKPGRVAKALILFADWCIFDIAARLYSSKILIEKYTKDAKGGVKDWIYLKREFKKSPSNKLLRAIRYASVGKADVLVEHEIP